MNNFNSIESVHRLIVMDLSVRTLERDRKYINDLKMHRAFEEWFDEKIKELQSDLRKAKADLLKMGVKIQSEVKEKDFTIYKIMERGQLYERRYSNIALRNWCQEETKRLLNLPFRTTTSGEQTP